MAKMKTKDLQTFGLIALGGVALYGGWKVFLYDPNKKEERQYASANRQELNKLIAANRGPSKSDATIAALADSIYQNLGFSAVTDNKAKAESLLKEPFVDADVLALIEAYGERQHWLVAPLGVIPGIPDNKPLNLAQMVQLEIDAAAKKRIHEDYLKKGISYRWQ